MELKNQIESSVQAAKLVILKNSSKISYLDKLLEENGEGIKAFRISRDFSSLQSLKDKVDSEIHYYIKPDVSASNVEVLIEKEAQRMEYVNAYKELSYLSTINELIVTENYSMQVLDLVGSESFAGLTMNDIQDLYMIKVAQYEKSIK